jgi:hypothetical protein
MFHVSGVLLCLAKSEAIGRAVRTMRVLDHQSSLSTIRNAFSKTKYHLHYALIAHFKAFCDMYLVSSSTSSS